MVYLAVFQRFYTGYHHTAAHTAIYLSAEDVSVAVAACVRRLSPDYLGLGLLPQLTAYYRFVMISYIDMLLSVEPFLMREKIRSAGLFLLKVADIFYIPQYLTDKRTAPPSAVDGSYLLGVQSVRYAFCAL